MPDPLDTRAGIDAALTRVRTLRRAQRRPGEYPGADAQQWLLDTLESALRRLPLPPDADADLPEAPPWLKRMQDL